MRWAPALFLSNAVGSLSVLEGGEFSMFSNGPPPLPLQKLRGDLAQLLQKFLTARPPFGTKRTKERRTKGNSKSVKQVEKPGKSVLSGNFLRNFSIEVRAATQSPGGAFARHCVCCVALCVVFWLWFWFVGFGFVFSFVFGFVFWVLVLLFWLFLFVLVLFRFRFWFWFWVLVSVLVFVFLMCVSVGLC